MFQNIENYFVLFKLLFEYLHFWVIRQKRRRKVTTLSDWLMDVIIALNWPNKWKKLYRNQICDETFRDEKLWKKSCFSAFHKFVSEKISKCGNFQLIWIIYCLKWRIRLQLKKNSRFLITFKLFKCTLIFQTSDFLAMFEAQLS